MADGILDCSFQPADEQASEEPESTSTQKYACSVHTSLPFALLRLLGADAVRGPAPSAPALAARAGSFCSASVCCSSCAPRAGWTPFAAASLSCWARPLRSVRFFSVCAFSTANSMIGRRSSPAVHVMLVMHARIFKLYKERNLSQVCSAAHQMAPGCCSAGEAHTPHAHAR